MFCPKCSAEAVEGEQKFCKVCGTNLQMVVDTLSRGTVSPETYKLDFESIKNNINDLGRGIRTAMQKGQKSALETRIGGKEIQLKRAMLECSRTRNLQKGTVGILTSIGMGTFFYYFGHAAVAAGTITNLEQLAHVTGFVTLAQMIWIVAIIPFLASVGHLINGIFFTPKSDVAFKQAMVSAGTTREMAEPASVTEDTTAMLYNAGPKGA